MERAKDLMTSNLITLETSMSLVDVLNIFVDKKLTSLPVISAVGKPLGLLTEQALVKGMVRVQGEKIQNAKVEHIEDLIEEPFFVNTEDSFFRVTESLIDNRVGRVLVLDEGNRLVGIISPRDLFDRFLILQM